MPLCKQVRNKTPYFLEANALSKISMVLPVLRIAVATISCTFAVYEAS